MKWLDGEHKNLFMQVFFWRYITKKPFTFNASFHSFAERVCVLIWAALLSAHYREFLMHKKGFSFWMGNEENDDEKEEEKEMVVWNAKKCIGKMSMHIPTERSYYSNKTAWIELIVLCDK